MLAFFLLPLVGLCGAVVDPSFDQHSWKYTCGTNGEKLVQCTAAVAQCSKVETTYTSRDPAVKALDIKVAQNLSPNFTLLWQDNEPRDYKVQLQRYKLGTYTFEPYACVSIAVDTTQIQNRTIEYNLTLPAVGYTLPNDVTWKILVSSVDGHVVYMAHFVNADNRGKEVLVRRTRVLVHARCGGRRRNVPLFGIRVLDKLIGNHPEGIGEFRFDFWVKNKTDDEAYDIGSIYASATSNKPWNPTYDVSNSKYRPHGGRYFIIQVNPEPRCHTGDLSTNPCFNGRCSCKKTPIRLDVANDCIGKPGLQADTSAVLPETSSSKSSIDLPKSGTQYTTHDPFMDETKTPKTEVLMETVVGKTPKTDVLIGAVVAGFLAVLAVVLVILACVCKISIIQTHAGARYISGSHTDGALDNRSIDRSIDLSIRSIDTRSGIRRWIGKVFGYHRQLSEGEIVTRNKHLDVMRSVNDRNLSTNL